MAMGAFEDERVELIEGVLVTKSPNDPQHAATLSARYAVGHTIALEAFPDVRIEVASLF
ncbi:MAG TPA: hypothetical protein VFK05_29695 [Polyangiaceae bacterium]|nr:hypothetical protein [Polyangiaceae bacterium]